jgi:hypothetical protein
MSVGEDESVHVCSVKVCLNWCPPIDAVLDSGAAVNVLSFEYWSGMTNRLSLMDAPSPPLLTVSGEPLQVCGVVSSPVRVAGTLLHPPVRFFVVRGLPAGASVILGLEFVLQHVYSTDWQGRTFSLRVAPLTNLPLVIQSHSLLPSVRLMATAGQPLQPPSLDCYSPAAAPLPAVLVRRISLRPHSSCLVNARVDAVPGTTTLQGQWSDYVFEPALAENPLETSVAALVVPVGGVFPVLAYNSSSKWVHRKARTVIGRIQRATVLPSPTDKMAVHPSRVGQIFVGGEEKEGADDASSMHLAPGVTIDLSNTIPLTDEQRAQLREMLLRNIAVFADNPKRTPTTTLAQHRIDTGSHPPVSVPPYRMPPSQRALIDQQAQEMLDNGVVRPSSSPYSSPVLLVKKSDGKDRFCVDFRRLNLLTKKDVYPLPRVDDLLDSLGKADYFTVLDLQSGFWQIPLHPDDMEKTAFSVARGHLEFIVMPFGLCNAPATFQRAMDQLLRDLLDFCQPYMDDVITYTEGTFTLHLDQLERVLQRLQSAPMVAKPSKFKVLQKELRFLGHIISRHTIRPDPAKTAAVYAFPAPTSVRDLQSFLGLVNYYRRFVQDLATIAAPLYQLLKKETSWRWDDSHMLAMQKLKETLSSPPLMALPNFDKDFVLSTDASATGLGAVLSQLGDDGTEHPVYFASRTLNDAERHYSTSERECLAVKWACGQFRSYLLGRPFEVLTDHAALKWLFTQKDPKSKFVRWILELQEYDMVIHTRPGVANGNADAMSRLPGLLEGQGSTAHAWISVVTRSSSQSLPPRRRGRQQLDPDLVLNNQAYDINEAIRQSLMEDVPSPQSTSLTSPSAHAPLESGDPDQAVEVESDAPWEEETSFKLWEEYEAPSPADVPPLPSTSTLATTSLAEAQRADSEWSPIIRYLEENNSSHPSVNAAVQTDSKEYTLYQGVLYHRWDRGKVKPRLSTSSYRAVIPLSLRPELLRQYHDGACGGHLGESKTYERIADKMFWPGMYRDISEYVLSCPRCGARKTTHYHQQTPLGNLPRPSQPFEALGIDVLGPLPSTRRKNRDILVITDYHTRWPIAFAMKNQRAPTIAQLLVEQVFCQHGFPATLLSDRGSNFLSDLMAAVLQIFHVRKLNTTAYHPQTNGLTERFNHTLCTMLSHYCNQHQTDWDDYLPYVLFAYRTTPHHTHKQTPFYLLYGRNPRFPFDSLLPTPPLDDLELSEPSSKHIDDLIERLKVASDVVDERFRQADQRRAKTNDSITAAPQYEVGAKVWLHNPVVRKGQTRKLTSPWTGPWQVVDKFNNLLNYKIHPLDKLGRLVNNAKSRLVHVARLKAYLDPSSSAIRSAPSD